LLGYALDRSIKWLVKKTKLCHKQPADKLFPIETVRAIARTAVTAADLGVASVAGEVGRE
jgi:hypothetical protein